jgi:hypothetical protein
MRPRTQLCALWFLLTCGCASLAIEMPRHLTLKTGDRVEIVGDIESKKTPVGGVDMEEGRLPPGLELEFVPEADSFAIRGVPSEAGHYEVDIGVWTYGTNFPGDRATVHLTIDIVD